MILRLQPFFSYIETSGDPAPIGPNPRERPMLDSSAQHSHENNFSSRQRLRSDRCDLFPLRPSRALQEAPPRVVEYTERVQMSTGEIRKGEVCATFYPELESNEFFRGLQRTETDEGRYLPQIFTVVATYPPSLRIQIDVRISICDADIYTPAPIPDFLKTLHFKVQWKKAMYLRPVGSFSVERIPLNLDQSENRKVLVVQIHDGTTRAADRPFDTYDSFAPRQNSFHEWRARPKDARRAKSRDYELLRPPPVPDPIEKPPHPHSLAPHQRHKFRRSRSAASFPKKVSSRH